MAAESKKSTEKADQRNNLLLCDNIQKMAELIRDDKRVKGDISYRLEDACKELGITYTSYRRWKNNPENLIAKRSLDPLYKNYLEKFLPSVSKPDDLIEKDLTGEMRLFNNMSIDFLKLFCSTFYVYYYSDLGPEEIHFGLLRLFTEGEGVSAKLVIGIPKAEGLHDADLIKVFVKDSNSYAEFKAYRKKRKRIEERYCHYYYGSVAISGPMLVLNMHGRDRNNNENDQELKVLINIRRIMTRQSENADRRPYLGGMSMVINMPNTKNTNLRIFRMGLSKWELPDEGVELFGALLRHNHEENHRIIMSDNDDRAWFHVVAKYQE